MGTRMTGRLTVIGLGPGAATQLTPEALAAFNTADSVFGYGPYLDRMAVRPGQHHHPSDNRQEIERAQQALTSAANGNNVAMVSGGDPGVFAMGAAVCEAIEYGPPAWRDIEVAMVPGISAMLAVAARVGAPLGHDFCAMSLSDNLKPWEVIERRLAAAATAGFVIALYNPISRARPWQLQSAFDNVSRILPPSTPIVFGRAVGRPDERVLTTELQHAQASSADMSTCIIIGSVVTRIIERPGKSSLVYTPRAMPSANV
jgi:precorrin-3B C17-methyltransferase